MINRQFSRTARARSVTFAFGAVVAAVACGAAETMVHFASAYQAGTGDLTTTAGALAVRLSIYALVLAVAWKMADGHRWARNTLAIGLGTVGLMSLLAEPLTDWAANGFGDIHLGSITAVAALRTGHVAAVVLAIVAMYRADARVYFTHR